MHSDKNNHLYKSCAVDKGQKSHLCVPTLTFIDRVLFDERWIHDVVDLVICNSVDDDDVNGIQEKQVDGRVAKKMYAMQIFRLVFEVKFILCKAFEYRVCPSVI